MGSQVPEGRYYAQEPIAIVGSSCRFPGGASSPSKLWDLLREPRDVVQEISPSRFSTEAFHHPDSQHHGSANVRHAYLLEQDPRVFDRDFFGINPKEAESMDPQQRILLETVYEGVESAGYSIQQLRGSSTGVFVGVMSFDYQLVAMRGLDSLPQYHATGGAMSILANRLSYFYDWKGPSMAVDTACSSSLVAMHQAVLALRNGEVKMAVVAGANLILGPEPFIAESKLNMLSPNGRSYMWDAAADGYTRGEGFSSVILKTLSQALADGDDIECIVRETGVNSDGRTPGITMPSPDAQAALIRSTYARCGLDPTSEYDRPQYFEAHGTGTPTGDPIEAQAIHSVFFPGESDQKRSQLLVGSIKTIIGHTEGTAGLAGVIKASLAVQHGQIPANLHFQNLNPKIRPFYNHLRIPTEITTWPAVPEGVPRRVSVNSFGFGGTNAHAIIESWDGSRLRDQGRTTESHGGGLFVLSANSGRALAAKAASLAGYLREYPDTNLARLARTLHQRAGFSFRAAFSATTTAQLVDKLDASKATLEGSSRIPVIGGPQPPRILGVFTGQGAQWATMGRELYQASEVFRRSIDQMQRSLDRLPERDGPDWSLVEELRAPAETSRIGTAVISQPLCTALQVALVNVLRAAGVEFAAVTGHSSGEIAAAYTAGYLDAHDAIRIAYYRGAHSHLAQGPGGRRGKMMAVGMSMDQASRFCGEFGAALKVAASNSQRSCTLAGDAEAVDEAESRLREAGTFVRVLEVDTAYHSHHMQPCAAPYLKSMQACGIKVQTGTKACPWYSSVWGADGRSRSFDNGHDRGLLKGQYWIDNLTQTVQFSQALSRAVTEEQCFDMVLEVGPHPALKGPSSETIQALTGLPLPYAGVLRRGEGAVEAFGDALGLVWKSFPAPRHLISFEGMRRAFPESNPKKPSILKGLPAYPWDHDSIIWHESRASRIFRTRSHRRHELLGHAVTHGHRQRHEVHWRQVLKLSEIPWLRGHKILDQFLFPATGYVTMAYEAAIRLAAEDQAVRLVELHNVEIHRPMSLQEESTGLEVLFILRISDQSDDCISAEFSCYSSPVDAGPPQEATAPGSAQLSGNLRILLGAPERGALPLRTIPQLPLGAVDTESLYSSLSDLGYAYTGEFRAPSMLRRLHHAVVSVPCFETPSLTRVDMHPATLDTAIHGIYAGITSPGDGRLRAVYLPTRIDCVRVNMAPGPASSTLEADSFVTLADAKTINGDIDVFSSADGQTQVQIRGVHMVAVPGSQKRSRQLYAGETWERDVSCGIDPDRRAVMSEERQALGNVAARTAFFYCRRLRHQIKPFEMILMGKQRRNLMNWILEDLLPKVEAGAQQQVRQEWLADTEDTVDECQHGFGDAIDVALLRALGQRLPEIVRGMAQPVKVLAQDGMLDRLYSEGFGFREATQDLGALVGQLVHRYPRMKLLELGAGSGATTRAVLSSIGDRYALYTCTDTSSETLPRDSFEGHSGRLAFGVLDIWRDPELQGHGEATYDVVIVCHSLYSSRAPDEALRNCRRLLRPGGYLVLLEMTGDHLPARLIKSLLPRSLLSGDASSEIVGVDGWDAMLRGEGFSGVDTSSSSAFCSVMLSQAVDGAVDFLRNPLSTSLQTKMQLDRVLVVGSSASCAAVARLALQTEERLLASGQTRVASVAGLGGIQVSPGTTVLFLGDLQEPIFDSMDQERFLGLQEMVQNADAILWVTSGAMTGENPKASMSIGWGRSIRAEHPDLKLQFLDVEHPRAAEPSMLAAHLLRLACQDGPEFEHVLWTHEPELALRRGALSIPRMRPLETLNRFSNARTLEVTQSVAVRDAGVAVQVDKHGDAVQAQIYQHPGKVVGSDQIRLQVSASSLCALHCQDAGSAHIVIGRDGCSGQKLLAWSRSNGSTVTIPEADVLYRWARADAARDDCVQLHLMLTALAAENALQGTRGLAWVHGAPLNLARALEHVASQHKIGLYQTTSAAGRDDGIRFIHPYITERDFERLRPRHVQTFVSFDPPQDNPLSRLARASMSSLTVFREGVTPRGRYGVALDFNRAAAGAILRKHAGSQDLGRIPWCEDFSKDIVGIHEVATRRLAHEASLVKVVGWDAAERITARVLPPAHDGLFSPAKTYVLFGLSGDVGISICKWMVEHGARTVVLASRKPTIPPSVVEYMSLKGAAVHATAVDIGDRGALLEAYTRIESTLPPVGGVMNGAAVWGDGLFVNSSWADFAAVLAPKVQGTENLGRVLDANGADLDFFILLSSVVAMAGNTGQTAYAAANLYMQGLVRARRRRGLPASVVHIGHLAGLGYVHRHHRRADLETALHQTMDPVSETDLHDLLAEAIVGGRPGSDRPADLVVGLKSGIQPASWRHQPRLQHYLVSDQDQDPDTALGEGADGHGSSIRAQLAAVAEDQDACLSILTAGFSGAVGAMLHMKPSEIDVTMSVANLGIDSLVAIRMREWFLQEIGVEVSVVKVMSMNISLTELCRDVLAVWRRLGSMPKAQ